MIEHWLKDKITGDASISALISDRLYPLNLPQNVTFPASVYQRVSSTRGVILKGSNGRVVDRFQLDFYATSYGVARQLASAATSLLHGFIGLTGGSQAGNVRLDSAQDFYEAEIGLYRATLDFIVTHVEE